MMCCYGGMGGCESDEEDLLCVGYDGERKGWAWDGNGESYWNWKSGKV